MKPSHALFAVFPLLPMQSERIEVESLGFAGSTAEVGGDLVVFLALERGVGDLNGDGD